MDLAAENGGNCEYTVHKEIFITPNGVKIVGYSDLPSRLASQSSNLFGNNVTKFLNYFLTKEGKFNLDLEDFIVRTSIITHGKEMMFPNPTPLPVLDKKTPTKVEVKDIAPVDLKAETLRKSLGISAGLASIVGFGVLCPDPSFLTMTSIFALAVVAG